MDTLIFDPVSEELGRKAWESIWAGEDAWLATPRSTTQGQAWWSEELEDGESVRGVLVWQDHHGLVVSHAYYPFASGIRHLDAGRGMWNAVSNLICRWYDWENRSKA